MSGDAFTITVRVVPRASKSEVVGMHAGELKVRIAAPPVDGAANAELIRLLAKEFGISKSAIEVISGETSKTKRLRISGVSDARVQQVLSTKS